MPYLRLNCAVGAFVSAKAEFRSQHEYARPQFLRLEVEWQNLVFRQLELERFFKNRFVVEIPHRDAHRTIRLARAGENEPRIDRRSVVENVFVA